jgi:hypothetical protein
LTDSISVIKTWAAVVLRVSIAAVFYINTMNFIKLSFFSVFIALAFSITATAQANGSLTGQVQDTLGASVVGASVTVVDAAGKEKITTSNNRGEFTMNGLAPGKYTVRVKAANFELYENTEVEIAAGQKAELTVPLSVGGVEEQVDVSSGDTVSNDPANNASATVLKEKDLDALPDDPEELEAALQALAGASAGPNGGQIYIDGFTGGRLPPKEAIREVRINQNPFSSEYDRLGFGRIEILTRPGADKFRGNAFFNFNDESLNSRNPFALNRAPSQTRFFGGNISGPIVKGKASYFLDINNRDQDNNAIVNAIVLDENYNPLNFREEFQVPSKRFSFSPRVDYAINDNNTLVFRYSFNRGTSLNFSGGTTLPSRASESENTEHEFRLTETSILNPRTVNETRFEYSWNKRERVGDNSIPAITVSDAFSGGGATVGNSFTRSNVWEIVNNTTTSLGANSQHTVKFGVRVRSIRLTDRSENGFGGSFLFTGLGFVAPLEQYRDTILDGLFPTQYSVTVGNPEQQVTRRDVGLFVSDDWRITPALTLSFGLRYENQTNISDNTNFAPRFAIAWSPGAGGAKAPKTVFRGGFGVFYDRFSENTTLQAERFNGVEQLNLVVSANDPDPARRAAAIALLGLPVFTLDGVTNVPTSDQIQAVLPQSNVVYRIDEELNVPTTYQWAASVERQLPWRTTAAFSYIGSKTTNFIRLRNINAPICPEQVGCANSPRPFGEGGAIYQYESTGTLNQNRLNFNVRSNLSPRYSLFANYSLGFSRSDTDGGFPSYSYDLSDEWGRAGFDVRHNIVVGGNFVMPWGISLNPFINYNSGRPFNITLGQDLNGDLQFTERPTFGQLGARCETLGLSRSYCDVSDYDPNEIIPRNFGRSPQFIGFNLRIGKTFGFGKSEGGDSAANTAGGGGGGGRGNRGGGGAGGPGGGRQMVMMGGGPGGFGGGGGRKPYNLNLSVNINNVFNKVNFAAPISNISSGRFGEYTSISGGFGGFGGFGGSSSANRRIELSARFSW